MIFFSKDRFKGDIKTIIKNDYIFTSNVLLGNPKIKGDDKWKILGYHEVSNEDLKIPNFKFTMKLTQLVSGYNLDKLDWYLIENLSMINTKEAPYQAVKHLGFFSKLNYKLISYKLTFEWILKNGEKVEDYFTNNDFETILGLSLVYANVKAEIISS